MRRATVFFALVLSTPLPSGCAWLRGELGAKPQRASEPTPEERRKRYVDAHPDLDAAARQAILEGTLREGMSAEQVTASLGRPRERGVLTPSSAEQGDEQWVFEEVAYGTRTSFEGGQASSARTFSGVRETRVRFWSGAVVGVDDLGYTTRDELVASCHAGGRVACDRVAELDARAASASPG